jgi:hypothetical protein
MFVWRSDTERRNVSKIPIVNTKIYGVQNEGAKFESKVNINKLQRVDNDNYCCNNMMICVCHFTYAYTHMW